MKNDLFEASDLDEVCNCGLSVPHEADCDAHIAAAQANTILTERDKVRDAELKAKWLEEHSMLVILSTKEQWLAELLRDAPVVYASLGGFNTDVENYIWLNQREDTHTHTAKLVCIEEIKK